MADCRPPGLMPIDDPMAGFGSGNDEGRAVGIGPDRLNLDDFGLVAGQDLNLRPSGYEHIGTISGLGRLASGFGGLPSSGAISRFGGIARSSPLSPTVSRWSVRFL